MSRTEKLKQDMLNAAHKHARIAVDPSWSVAHLPISLPERKAEALCKILENMPLYIGDEELIVGSRTVFGHRGEEKNRSDMSIFALPDCVNEEEIARFGRNDQMRAAGHFTPDYGIVLKEGIDGIRRRTIACGNTDFLRAVARVYEGLSHLIERYAQEAGQRARSAGGARQRELLEISENCRVIAHEPPKTFWQAAQLIWFTHLSLLIESFQFVSYGRLDQLLAVFHREDEHAREQQLIDCLVIKMYDGGDVIDSYFGTYSGQHTLTLGGLTPEGEDGVNPVTFMFLDAVRRVGLPEPMVEIRYHAKNPPAFLESAAQISISGINTVAYYRDELFIRNLKAHGLTERDANNYAFGLCQDVLVPGRLTPFAGLSVNLAEELLRTLRQAADDISFESLLSLYLENLRETIDRITSRYNQWCAGIAALNAGDQEAFLQEVRQGKIPLSWAKNSPMAPILLASALFDGCLEAGVNLALYPHALPYKGVVLGNPVIAFNGLAAIRQVALKEKRYTISQIISACDQNFEGQEIMRQRLWNAPKWGNGDDLADAPAREIIETCCRRITSLRTFYGTPFLAGIHQPHPVSEGWHLQATPEGRKAREPVPVTLSPENGTLKNGPTAALNAVAQIDDRVYQWNICLMLSLSASLFAGPMGVSNFCRMLKAYFQQGGAQFQPNIVRVESLRDAQLHPENYRDLVVRLWGVSVQFINLPREIQDEFIARF